MNYTYKDVIRFYQGYINRNSSFEEFARDVNTLGGTFHGGFLDTTLTHAVISDEGFNETCRLPLRDIYRNADQLSIF